MYIGPQSAVENKDGTTTLNTKDYWSMLDKLAWLWERFDMIEAGEDVSTQPVLSAGSALRIANK